MGAETGSASPADKLIVVIDDDDSVRELLEFVVKKEGFRTGAAADGEEGLRKIEALRPDLVVLDLMLPKYGGFEVLRRLQGKADTAEVPIVVITGRYTDRATMEMIRQESNVAEFLEKPVKPPVLAASLHRILKTRAPADSLGAEGPA